MPRPILGEPGGEAGRTTGLRITPPTPTRPALRGPKLEQHLRQKRSSSYIDAVKRLDAGRHLHNRAGLDALIAAIRAEFPELTIDQQPLGLVAECFLGSPYEVHICDLAGQIIEHFETYRNMPPLFERARRLALHPAYAFVEIYPNSLRAVGKDGEVSVIEE